EVLSPELTAAMQIVWVRMARPGPVDYLRQILDHKQRLAAAASQWMIPVYDGDTSDPRFVREAFYQQLLSRLSNAYATRAATQFRARVTAKCVEPIADQPPRLLGSVIDRASAGETRSEITLTSPKLALERAGAAPLPFLLLAPDQLRQDGAVVPRIEL